MRDAPIHCFVQLARAVVVLAVMALAVMALAVVARHYVLAVGFGLVFWFGSQFRYTMCQAIPWTYNMRKNVVFDCWY